MRKYAGPGTYDTSSYFRGVCEAIASVGPGAFMISPGDIDPPANVQWTIQQHIDSTYIWYTVVGNHEAETPGDMSWLRNYNSGGNTLPYVVNIGPTGCEETTYSFDYQNAHFVVLNEYYNGYSDTGTDGDVVDSLYNWLANDLAETSKAHIFVFGHEPAYPQPDADNGRRRHIGDSLDKYPAHRDRFWDLLRDHDVVAFFCGHTHNYSAVKLGGVWQVDAGHCRGKGDTGAPSTFVVVQVDGDDVEDVTFNAYRDTHDGVYDYDDIVHSWSASLDPVPPERIADLTATLTGSIHLGWSPVTLDTLGWPEVIQHYLIYRDTVPDFVSSPANSLAVTVEPIYADTSAGQGNPSINHFYLVRAVDDAGNKSLDSNRVGEFDRSLARCK